MRLIERKVSELRAGQDRRMTIAVLYYSRTGNNRLLARLLAGRLGAELIEVRPRRKRYFWRMMSDMSRDRRPQLMPLDFEPERFGLVVVVAPVHDLNIAHPMKTALETYGGRFGRYAFVTFCGYVREGQAEALRSQAEALTGKSPMLVEEFFVGDLVPESRRRNVFAVSGKRVKESEMTHFAPQLDRLAAALTQLDEA